MLQQLESMSTESLEEIKKNGFVLTPGRYIGAAEIEKDTEPFKKVQRLKAQLHEMQSQGQKLDA